MEDIKREYKYEFPKYFVGDKVSVMTHNHGIQPAKIIRVETHYGNNKAYHIYSVAVKEWKRHLHLGEECIRYIMK